MLSLNNLKPNKGSKITSKRLWRWNGSGKWTYSTRGCKWQNARSWGWVWAWFEWGQTPLFRRMPKLKWFSNAKFKVEFSVVNLSDLEILASKWIVDITKESLLANGVIKNKNNPVKVLWNWELKSKISLKVNKISASALDKVKSAWWDVELI